MFHINLIGFINKFIITQYVIIITIYESCERDKCFAETSETSSLDLDIGHLLLQSMIEIPKRSLARNESRYNPRKVLGYQL